jgi:DNA-binding CsgD family transcriptional regulator
MRKLLYLLLFLSSTLIAQHSTLIEEISITDNKSDDFLTIKKTEFLPLNKTKLGSGNGIYWFKIKLKEEAFNKSEFVFNFSEPSISSVVVYNATTKITEKFRSIGETNIHMLLIKNSELTYYFKVHFKRQVNATINASSFTVYQEQKKQKSLLMGLYYGIVFMVFMFNLIFFFSSKDITFLYYCLFLGAINFSFTGFDGMLYLLFDPEKLDILFIISHFLIQLFGALFAASFLNLHTFSTKYKIGLYSLIVPFVFYVAYFATSNFLFVAIADVLGMIILAFFWVLGVITIKKDRFSSFFVVGYSMILFAGFLFVIPMNFGLFEGATFNQLKLGAIFEMIVLTYAITYRAKKIQEENINIQIELKQYVLQATALETRLKEATSKDQLKTSTESRVSQIVATYHLTERETDILLQISLGKNNQQIADELFISINTVKYHTRNLYEKLNVKKRSEVTSKILFDN